MPERSRSLVLGSISLLAGLLIWQVSARMFFSPVVLPAPSRIGREALETLRDGTLAANVAASLFRILAGFALGSVLGALLGLAMGMLGWVRRLLDPVVNFLRFIPPIAWISPFLIWFGIGETSKILLITYTVTFMVLLNTIAGISAIPRNRMRAARSMGANRRQIFCWIVVPSVVPYILTGMRIGMANAFTTIVTAEMIAAQAGLGFLILVSKNYGATDLIMLGMIVLGVLGLLTDRLFVAGSGRFARRFYLM
jgi:ABC-type nitrate/sulfonate/bicarbonate transport system permease component